MILVYFLAILIVVTAVGAVADQIRLSRHRSISRTAFIEEFQKESIPAEIPAAVYDHYKSLCRSKNFGVAPEDTYDGVFRECHEDIDEDAEELAEKLNIELPIECVLRQWPTPLRTLRDMVLWLNWVRQLPR